VIEYEHWTDTSDEYESLDSVAQDRAGDRAGADA
jgi:hypothetical protein